MGNSNTSITNSDEQLMKNMTKAIQVEDLLESSAESDASKSSSTKLDAGKSKTESIEANESGTKLDKKYSQSYKFKKQPTTAHSYVPPKDPIPPLPLPPGHQAKDSKQISGDAILRRKKPSPEKKLQTAPSLFSRIFFGAKKSPKEEEESASSASSKLSRLLDDEDKTVRAKVTTESDESVTKVTSKTTATQAEHESADSEELTITKKPKSILEDKPTLIPSKRVPSSESLVYTVKSEKAQSRVDTVTFLGHNSHPQSIACDMFCYACNHSLQSDPYVYCDQHWFHRKCFRCRVCQRELRPGTHIITDRFLYCRQNCIDHEQRARLDVNASEILAVGRYLDSAQVRFPPVICSIRNRACVKCNRNCTGHAQVSSQGRVWHAACFQCTLCGRQLTTNDLVIRCNQLFCQFPCFERLFG